MALKPTSRRPIGKQAVTPRRRGKTPAPSVLALPIERDASIGAVAVEPDPQIVQAQRDIEAGQVDTDMLATPGLDAQRRPSLVPGPGGKPLQVIPATLAQQKSDFTAEGSPPPGRVSTSTPELAKAPVKPGAAAKRP